MNTRRKTYISPQMELVTIAMTEMIAFSIGEQTNYFVNGQNDELDARDALSKERSEDGFDWNIDLW